MWLSATKQSSMSGIDCILSPMAKGRVKNNNHVFTFQSELCSSSFDMLLHTHRLLKMEAKPTCGNGWQVTHCHQQHISLSCWAFNGYVWFCDSSGFGSAGPCQAAAWLSMGLQ